MKTRRIIVYWIILFASTLIMGGSAFLLLQREKERLDDLAVQSIERDGATIADNVGLLVSEAKTGLMTGLQAIPEEDMALDLVQWMDGNDLIAAVYVWLPHDVINVLVKEPDIIINANSMRELLSGESGQLVWNDESVKEPDERIFPIQGEQEEIQQTKGSSRASSNGKFGPFLSQRANVRTQTKAASRALTPNQSSDDGTNRDSQEFNDSFMNTGLAMDPGFGWQFVDRPDMRTWIAWYRPGDTLPARGLVLNMDALVPNLAASLPEYRTDSFSHRYHLNDEKGELITGDTDSLESGRSITIPIGPELPGWTLTVIENRRGEFQKAFLAVGMILVIVFSLFILSGGTLLLMTARREVYEASRKTTFVSNISHELKTPITTIRMYAEMLLEGRVKGAGKKEQYLATITEESHRLSRLVNNVLDFSRLELGRKRFRPDNISLQETIPGILEVFSPRMTAEHIELQYDPGDETVNVLGDRDAFEQAFINLLDNAIKYGGRGGSIGLKVDRDSFGYGRVTISDRGPGIEPVNREKVFQSYFRGDDRLTAENSGTGLGLGIARKLMRGCHGDVVYQPRKGGGAAFIITLPLGKKVNE